jgi:hypothetical protein
VWRGSDFLGVTDRNKDNSFFSQGISLSGTYGPVNSFRFLHYSEEAKNRVLSVDMLVPHYENVVLIQPQPLSSA